MSKGTDHATAYLKYLNEPEQKDERASLRGATLQKIVQAGGAAGHRFEAVDLLAVLPIPKAIEERWLAADAD